MFEKKTCVFFVEEKKHVLFFVEEKKQIIQKKHVFFPTLARKRPPELRRFTILAPELQASGAPESRP